MELMLLHMGLLAEILLLILAMFGKKKRKKKLLCPWPFLYIVK